MKGKEEIKIMQANLTILRYHGAWPTYLNGQKDKFYHIKLSIVCCALLFVWSCSILHLTNVAVEKKQNVESEVLDDISIFLGLGGEYCILILFLWKRKDIARLIQELGEYRNFGKPEDVENVNRTFNFYTKLYYLYCIVGANIYFTLAQTVEVKICKEKNEKFGRNEVCGFFTHMWLPFDYGTTPTYQILCAVHYLSCNYAGPLLIIPFTVFVMLQHLICKIRHLKGMAAEVFNSEDPSIQRERLGNWISYHQTLIRLSDKFNCCFGQIMFLYLTLGAAILSITCYESLKNFSLGAVFHLGAWLMAITLICNAGQQLYDESKSISVTFYNLPWMDADDSTKTIVKIIIMRAQKALCLNALSFGSMDRATFAMIIKTAYKYLTVMSQTM